MPGDNPDGFTRRRYVYLAASLMMLTRAGELPWSIIAIAGLVFFLAWVLSGMFEKQLRLQRAAHSVLRRYDAARRARSRGQPPMIFVLMELSDKYEQAVKEAGMDMWQPHVDVLAALSGRDGEIHARLRTLRRWLRWRPWHRIL